MAALIVPGTLKAFNSTTYRARVTLTGSLQMGVDNLPVSRPIPSAEMVAGRKATVLLLDETKATADAVVVAVWT